MALSSPPVPGRLDEPAARHWDFPRSAAGVAVVVSFAREHGLGTRDVLRGTGIPESALHDPAAVVTADAELSALRNLVASRAPGAREAGAGAGCGLELGARYHVTSFGILGFALASSRTVLDAMNLALRFLDLSHVFTTPDARVEEGEVVVRFGVADLPGDLARFLVERDVSAISTVLSELVPGGVRFSAVRLPFPAPADPAPYERHLGVLPVFGADVAELRFPVGELHRRLPQGNPHSQALAEALCRDVVARRRGSRRAARVEELVRLWITRNVAHDASMARAAGALAMSQRTLRRRLAAEGTGYQALLDEVRAALAEEMLSTGLLGVEDVALRLGYAEASSFIHAFRRWRGATPARFQRDRLAEEPPVTRARRAAPGSAG
jgi:AraC-like DNA-binding protein